MDRSADSIGSCSLDVDADSTDFSDTSGSLNLPTPTSGKDITREFTSRIKERCQISQINCQQTTTILDPASGKISTIITTGIDSPVCSPIKKPSYLNLACCVNGYSNLTTYDSKLRQNINKSREVSPIRPLSNSLQYCKTSALCNNLLAPPVPISNCGNNSNSFINKSPNSSGNLIMEHRNMLTQTQQVHEQLHKLDSTETVITNGKYFKSTTKYLSSSVVKSSTSTIQSQSSAEIDEPDKVASKSFIQQRVERLYGPGALAQGFYSPKKHRNQDNSAICQRILDVQNEVTHTNNSSAFIISQDELNNSTNNNFNYNNNYNKNNNKIINFNIINHCNHNNKEHIENLKNGSDLPVLRHLRPEFRAQLPILSPKRSQIKLQETTITTTACETDKNPGIINGNLLRTYMNGDVRKLQGSLEPSSNLENDQIVVVEGDVATNVIIPEYSQKLSSIAKFKTNYEKLFNEESIKSDFLSDDKNYVIEHAVETVNNTKIDPKKFSNEQVNNKTKTQLVASTTEYKSSVSPDIVSKAATELQADQKSKESECDNIIEKVDDKIVTMTEIMSDQKYSNENNINSNNNNSVDRDGNYFIRLLKTEQNRLLDLAASVEKEMNLLSSDDVSDEIFGYLRSASGKARLLVSQKMKQFEGLCKNNLNQLPDEKFPTTNEDLQGFWDMVLLQVDHIDSLFKEIEHLKANDWKKPFEDVPRGPHGSKLIRRPLKSSNCKNSSVGTNVTNGTIPKKSSGSSLAAQKRETQRKQLMELKRKQKMAISAEQQQQNKNQVEIFINDMPSS